MDQRDCARSRTRSHVRDRDRALRPRRSPLRVAAAIAEEAKTRELQETILSEITATADRAFLKAAAKGIAGSTFTSDVQRDFFPGKDRLTVPRAFRA